MTGSGASSAVCTPARLAILVVSIVSSGCHVAPANLPEAPRDVATSRAALATLVVENLSSRAVAIGYEYLESGGGTVIVGRLPPESTDTLPPVPAREPIVLFARDSLGAVLRTAPRSLEIDSTFVWRIPVDAIFTPPEP